MKSYSLCWKLMLLCAVLVFPFTVNCQESKPLIPNKTLCNKMVRFGEEALMRKRYEEARQYFRRAIQADPSSTTAWRYYDQAVISALAQKLESGVALSLTENPEKAQKMSLPVPSELPAHGISSKSQPQTGPGFEIIEDEGC